jgi:hypothetical protein
MLTYSKSWSFIEKKLPLQSCQVNRLTIRRPCDRGGKPANVSVCDTVTIMRDGTVIAESAVADTRSRPMARSAPSARRHRGGRPGRDSIMGGVGSVARTLLGVFFLGAVNILNLPIDIQLMAKGAIIVIALAVAARGS